MSYALYDMTTSACSKIITNSYSTSFSLGIKSLDESIREDIYNIYGFVRLADEIVDTFYDQNQEDLFDHFCQETEASIKKKFSINPVLHAFQKTVWRYDIPLHLIDSFLRSMEMDLKKTTYDAQSYDDYIYGSAEVVGLMCLCVFCGDRKELFSELEPYARSLGSAFQKINFLRDIKSDQEDRGRTYFPNINFDHFSLSEKKLIEEDIQKDFDHGLIGIKKLPDNCRFGVYLAYIYYTSLFKKIKMCSHQEVKQERIRVSDVRKVWLLFKSSINLRLGRY